MADNHPTTILYDHFGYPVDIDEEIANLIDILWENDYETDNSCQNNFVVSQYSNRKKHFVWIEFTTLKHAERFIKEYVGEVIDRFYQVDDTWELKLNFMNVNTKYYPEEDTIEDVLPLKLIFPVSVRFPKKQLPKVEARFRELYT